MASSTTGGTLPPNFVLTPQQQSLLFAALNSNKQQQLQQQQQQQQQDQQQGQNPALTNAGLSFSPAAFSNASPGQQLSGANIDNLNQSPYLDGIDYEFGDSSFDFSFNEDQGKMNGDVPETAASTSTENEAGDTPDKRSHPRDEGDEASPGNDPKRRGSSEKVPKKPGRKPLTSEPTSKRKAQNRAAQRAFRERKEQHVKDLETKVDELQQASEAANHENTKLRAQIEQMTSELNQYKQRVTVTSSGKGAANNKVSCGPAAVNHLSDVNFQFEFPKFGMLPGPPKSLQTQRSSSSPLSMSQSGQAASPANAKSQSADPKSPPQPQTLSDAQFREELAKFSNVFTPSMASSSAANGSRVSLDSGNYSSGNASSSPSASSHSNNGPSSSCGTSPEPFTQSPMGFKPVDTMTTIGEEQPTISTSDQPFAQFANVDISNTNFDWLAQQNGGSFDPQLFGDYREPQDNILANTSFDDFFNDALDADFITPYNTAMSPNHVKKTNLIDEIDSAKNDDSMPKNNMNCNQIWEKLQSCPKAQTGEFDLDGLCSDLTKKAKCSGSGPVVGEMDFNSILNKYMGKDGANADSADCMAKTLGVQINRGDQTNSVVSLH